MKQKQTYTGLDGKPFTLEYDTNDPCAYCNEPVTTASMGGTAVCPWCDMGVNRDGTRWDAQTAMRRYANFRRRAHEQSSG